MNLLTRIWHGVATERQQCPRKQHRDVCLRLSKLDVQSPARKWDTLRWALTTHEELLCKSAWLPGSWRRQPKERTPTRAAPVLEQRWGLQSWAEKPRCPQVRLLRQSPPERISQPSQDTCTFISAWPHRHHRCPLRMYTHASAVCVLSHFSRVWLFGTPWTIIRHAALSMGFSR